MHVLILLDVGATMFGPAVGKVLVLRHIASARTSSGRGQRLRAVQVPVQSCCFAGIASWVA